MRADLILSRPGYQAGAPVVGTVRIHRASLSDSVTHQRQTPIRDEIVSARLYLAGRAHLGSNAPGKVSRWRSKQEVNQLKKIYGEHACLIMAKMEEKSSWSEWNSDSGNEEQRKKPLDDEHGEAGEDSSKNDPGLTTKATFYKPVQPPQVTHIEQAERLAVHSSLYHSYLSTNATSDVSNDDDVDADNQPKKDYSDLPTPHENNVICVWMTNVLELLDIPERHLDRKDASSAENGQCQLRPGRGKFHGDMNPYRPLQLPDLDVVRDVVNEMESRGNSKEGKLKTEEGENVESSVADMASSSQQSAWERIVASANPTINATSKSDGVKEEGLPLEQMQLALSFRADLPTDVPPTMSAECVKYFYSTVLVVTTVTGELLVTQCPFAVLTSDSQHTSSQKSHQTSTTRVHIGDLHAIAHSAGLPTYLSATVASDATPIQLNVVANPPACDIVSRRTAEQRTSTHRIVDGKGCFCGLMTLVGIGGPLVLGTRLGIRLRFPIYDDDAMANGAGIIPCHRVCCGLVGEEYAIFEGPSTSKPGAKHSQNAKKRVKTRSYVFDSAYEMVEFGYTEEISMGLVLPLDCPVTVKTDLVEVKVMLKVEFTVSCTPIISQMSENGGEAKDQGEFSAIRLDLPCEVVNFDGESNKYSEEGEGEDERISSIRTMQPFWKNDQSERDVDGFDDTDIQSDLKMLSLRMIGELTSM